MAEDSKSHSAHVLGLIVEFVIVVAVGLGILFFFLFGDAFQRGFYCDDESLRHPYKDSTVPSYYLYIVGFGANLIAMVIGEYACRDRDAKVRIGPLEIPKWAFDFYKAFILFCFGAACSQLITDSLKYMIGRLRPHFYTLCQPEFKLKGSGSFITCETQGISNHLHEYIEHFNCLNKQITDRQLKEMRLSFPSGHSSFGMYTMLYLALYIGARWKFMPNYRAFKHILQYGVVLMALLVGMSRVSDYKHHWSDVLGGLTIGIVSALVTGVFIAKLFNARPTTTKDEVNRNGNNANVIV